MGRRAARAVAAWHPMRARRAAGERKKKRRCRTERQRRTIVDATARQRVSASARHASSAAAVPGVQPPPSARYSAIAFASRSCLSRISSCPDS